LLFYFTFLITNQLAQTAKPNSMAALETPLFSFGVLAGIDLREGVNIPQEKLQQV